MAQKGYPTNNYQQPPAVYPPHQSGHTVIVQQQPVIVGAQRPSRGLFGQLGHEINQFGKTVSREADYLGGKVDRAIVSNASGSVLNLFQSGNRVQLVSKVTGRTIQIVSGPMGLVVDGLGGEGAPAYNAVWTVLNEGSNQVRLHNNYNFLSIMNGTTTLRNMPQGSAHGPDTKFQLVKILDQFVVLESIADRRHHIGIMPDGQLKSALATGREDHAQFGVRIIH